MRATPRSRSKPPSPQANQPAASVPRDRPADHAADDPHRRRRRLRSDGVLCRAAAGTAALARPGAFGTLGVGAGFALGAKLVHPQADVWVIYGDGSFGYSAVEFDTFVRHGTPVVAVVGNDASWSQIAPSRWRCWATRRDGSWRTATITARWKGLAPRASTSMTPKLAAEALDQARQVSGNNKPVVVNAILGKTDFRKGSISM